MRTSCSTRPRAPCISATASTAGSSLPRLRSASCTRSAKVFAAISPPTFPGPSPALPVRSEPMSLRSRAGRMLAACRICGGSHGGDQGRAAGGDVCRSRIGCPCLHRPWGNPRSRVDGACRVPVRGTRILLVVGPHDEGDESTREESPSCSRRSMRASHLACRLDKRLDVIAPRYVTVRIRASIVAAPRVDPERASRNTSTMRCAGVSPSCRVRPTRAGRSDAIPRPPPSADGCGRSKASPASAR